ncbi:cytochrome d ubiquinol oxidase subunit II [Desulfonema ishimotonii]|uniref:Cytochrome d ubiquinol oxidase subunit II n=1 Tax=Desulfonema ishimotonii TaxID=45657 RepID=A0A401FZR3_9BACT|nr:cytochrome d ubiquinol oxidase subunit II [Desulfonema ishimotonii]GBC62469.1 cytochrome d ubiquinol oxidase subunit II [Desulfonema ishimotonii]
MDIVQLWNALVGVVIILYVILDGFGLGIGILFPTAKSEEERDVLMNSIAPIWDANQTWIVFGGGALFAAFPMIYTVLFSALYIPLLSFLFGLIFRGVAFEFRINTNRKYLWNWAFFLGSLLAVLNQGFVLGGYISGIKVVDGAFAGGPFDWLNPFTVMVGIALVVGYVLLGSTFLIIKTEGAVQERAYKQAFWAAMAVACFMIVVSIWTPYHAPDLTARWFTEPRLYFVWNFPLLGLVAFGLLLRSLKKRRELMPFISSVLLFLSAYFGLQSALWPLAIPPDLTIYEAAAQRETQIFTLWGVAIVLPVVLTYTIYSYRVFRGKVGGAEGYH